MSEWQVYRLFEARRGAWSTFQFLVRERLREEGIEVEAGGALTPVAGHDGQEAGLNGAPDLAPETI